MKKLFLSLFLLLAFNSFSQNKTLISGYVTDAENKKPITDVNVTVDNTKAHTKTNASGKFSILLESGAHILKFSSVGYNDYIEKINIENNNPITLTISLAQKLQSLENVVVTSASRNREKESALLIEQKKAVEIKQSIGAQEMARKGISDVEEGLTKITGITKVESRGLFVRGLEDRYNNLLINNLASPTNNPFKKILPLDIFPTDIVSVIDVYKTFNPNIYGDFAGATFNIETTKENKPITKFTVGTGFTTQNNLSGFLISDDDAVKTNGFFGFNGDDRNLPAIFGNTASSKTLTGIQSINAFKSGFDVKKTKSPLNTSIGILHSDRYTFKNNNKLGYLLSLNFENSYLIRKGVERIFNNAIGGYNYKFDFFNNSEYKYKTSNTALLNLNYTGNGFLKLNWNTFYIKTTENSIKDQYGYADKNANENLSLIRTNQLDKSDYIDTQLLGEADFNKNKKNILKFGASYVLTKYSQPDRKSYSGVINQNNPFDAETIITSIGGNNYVRQYLDIKGNYFMSGMAEFSKKFGSNDKYKVAIGYNGNATDMQSNYRFVSPVNDASNPNGVTFSLNTPDAQLNNMLYTEAFKFRESSNSTYRVKLKENINTAYVNLAYKSDKIELNGGIRFEKYIRETKYRELGSFTDPYKKIKLDKTYFLPSLNFKYTVNTNSNLRFAASKTYTKPVLMEAYPIEYINPDGTSMRGNPTLINSDNYNADLKYELFPNSKEMIAIGVFGKLLNNPIERTISNAASTNITTFTNSNKATLYGVEFEYILALERISKNLSNFSIGFNTSLMDTKVDVASSIGAVGTIESNATRKLQGASNWLINSDLKYQFNFSKNWSNTATLIYAVFGKRIYAVGIAGMDHIYELPVNQLNFVWNAKVSKHFDAKLSIDNILNPEVKRELGNKGLYPIIESSAVTNSFKRGTSFSTSISYSF